MKAMKSLGMKSMLDSVRGKPNPSTTVSRVGPEAPPLDTPEANAQRGVISFCESGGPGGQQGEEVLYLPTIVEAAEGAPSAAAACAKQIRKYLAKEFGRPHTQYNAIMLMRILSDNPGPSFTQAIDTKFVDAVKNLLRAGSDPGVRQILTETLGVFEREKSADSNLGPLLQMWKREQEKLAKAHGPNSAAMSDAQRARGQRQAGQAQISPHAASGANYFARSHAHRGLPAPQELSSRIEEARTTAKLLTQLVQSTPPQDLLQNELVREFANRCTSASRSIQGYITAENPGPDNDTMLTLIETTEQLALAQTKHQRAVLNARKALGLGNEVAAERPGSQAATDGMGSNGMPPPGPPPGHTQSTQPQVPQQQTRPVAASIIPVPPPTKEDPFRDPSPKPGSSTRPGASIITTSRPTVPEDSKPRVSSERSSTPQQQAASVEPKPNDASYNPGYNPTQSYVGRQESSVGHVTMHAAVAEEPHKESTREQEDEEEEEEDLYAATPPPTKKPVYRF